MPKAGAYSFSCERCLLFMKNIKKHIAVLALLLIVPIRTGFAAGLPYADSIVLSKIPVDSADHATLYWLSLGGGVIGSLLGGDIKATYAWNEHQSINAKICGASELTIFGPPGTEINEYGVYFGMHVCDEWWLLRLAAGPSYFTGIQHHRTESIHHFGIGAEAEAMVKYQYVGISIMPMLMYTPKFFEAGIIMNVSIGKLH